MGKKIANVKSWNKNHVLMFITSTDMISEISPLRDPAEKDIDLICNALKNYYFQVQTGYFFVLPERLMPGSFASKWKSEMTSYTKKEK